jgi:hypothetical protein
MITQALAGLIHGVEPIISAAAVALLITGLVGNAYELRKISKTMVQSTGPTCFTTFLNKRNWKWYLMIGISLALFSLSFAHAETVASPNLHTVKF